MRAILCTGGKNRGCHVVDFTDAELEAAHAKYYPADKAKDEPVAASEPQPELGTLDQPEPPAAHWPPPRGARAPNLVKIPANTPREHCKAATCRQAIWMVKHPKTGKPTPATCQPELTLKDGTVVGTGAFPPYLNAAPGRETLPMDGLGYSHFIDCPESKAFKKK